MHHLSSKCTHVSSWVEGSGESKLNKNSWQKNVTKKKLQSTVHGQTLANGMLKALVNSLVRFTKYQLANRIMSILSVEYRQVSSIWLNKWRIYCKCRFPSAKSYKKNWNPKKCSVVRLIQDLTGFCGKTDPFWSSKPLFSSLPGFPFVPGCPGAGAPKGAPGCLWSSH